MKKRVLYYDVLNIVSAFCVIAMHCNSLVYGYNDSFAWRQSLFVETFAYWPVPIFLMISGATLVGYRDRYTTSEFFKKRVLKTTIPFVIWSLISAFANKADFSELGIRGVLNGIVTCSFEEVYWFFPMLFSMYLAMPVISLLKDNRKILWYMVGTAFILNSVLPIVFRWLGLTWNSSLSAVTVSGFLIFPILGYLLSIEEIKKQKRIVLYAAAFGCAAFRFGMTVVLSRRDGALNTTYFDYLGFYSIILSAGVFVFAKNSRLIEAISKKEKIVNVIKIISGCSFGVYLLHMQLINKLLVEVFPKDSLEWRIVGPVLVYILAVAIVFVIKKIPLVKKIVP